MDMSQYAASGVAEIYNHSYIVIDGKSSFKFIFILGKIEDKVLFLI